MLKLMLCEAYLLLHFLSFTNRVAASAWPGRRPWEAASSHEFGFIRIRLLYELVFRSELHAPDDAARAKGVCRKATLGYTCTRCYASTRSG